MNEERRCDWVKKLCYGMGHVYNDLCAAMWFSYTLFYLQIVLQMEATTAGTLIMTGQIVDSLATPVVGCAVDRTGARRAWHLAGTLAVSVGFSLIYCLKPTSLNTWMIIDYGLVISLFQIGWAVTQISHLSIIPEIATTHSYTSDLTAIRYTASVCSSISVYLITLVVLKNDNDPNKIGPGDFYKFKEIALIITLIGIFSSLIFYCGALTKEDQTDYATIPGDESVDSSGLVTNEDVTHFLKSSIIYKVSLMYMASRLFTTLTLIYIPLYLDEKGAGSESTGDGIRQTIASVPLVCFVASFLTSILVKFRWCGDKVVYLVGIVLALIASVWIKAGSLFRPDGQLYIIASLIGVSGSATMVSSLCLTAEFVKVNGYGGASVYSMVTFTDKLISGGVVLLVQNLQCTPKEMCPHFYEDVLSYVCGLVSLIGLVSLATLHCRLN
ncbi:major facilitator superfamily domain-containing protein 12-like isoform X1 [Tenebrio molitor]|uniref:major facilitator superfamily domain-containing protein 12-like isoform X1 n=1 Tax=Tenebrio molitor TaxID=7067 RepID=UPI003624A127